MAGLNLGKMTDAAITSLRRLVEEKGIWHAATTEFMMEIKLMHLIFKDHPNADVPIKVSAKYLFAQIVERFGEEAKDAKMEELMKDADQVLVDMGVMK